MWRHRLVGFGSVLALLAVTACGGGGVAPNLVPPGSGQSGQSTSRFQATTPPSKRIQDIYARKAVQRGSIQDPLANWVFLEPLSVTDSTQVLFSAPLSITKCATPIDPIFGGNWYLSLTNFTLPVSTISLPSCTLPATTSSTLAKARPDAIAPAGNGNIYIVEIDAGLIYLSTTPIAGPALNGGPSTFLFGPENGNLSFSQFSVYAFFLAEYTGTGTPTTVTI
jgi:hypothetical protein